MREEVVIGLRVKVRDKIYNIANKDVQKSNLNFFKSLPINREAYLKWSEECRHLYNFSVRTRSNSVLAYGFMMDHPQFNRQLADRLFGAENNVEIETRYVTESEKKLREAIIKSAGAIEYNIIKYNKAFKTHLKTHEIVAVAKMIGVADNNDWDIKKLIVKTPDNYYLVVGRDTTHVEDKVPTIELYRADIIYKSPRVEDSDLVVSQVGGRKYSREEIKNSQTLTLEKFMRNGK